ncbi:MAG: raffinose/stachyose/melibiose transport system permease protein [Candidatus Omnitrophota bacterium]|jgi:raffinose/stachyose/melibiose transport system permease protein
MKRFSFDRLKEMGSRTLIHLVLLAVSSVCIFPLWWAFSSSLKTQATVFSDMSFFPANPQWGNYLEAWTKGHFGTYFLNSCFYTTVVVAGVILISSLAAYAFSRFEFPGRDFLFFMLISTMMIPVPGTIIPLYVLLVKLGLANTQLGYILPQINGGLALGIFLLKTFFDDLPKELEESARIDGCGRLRVYWHIALPLAKPAIAVLAIFNVLNVWNEYILAMLVLSDRALMPLQRGLMVFQGAHITQYPLLMAGIIITIAPVILIYLALQKYIIKGITAGAVKG